MSPDMSMSSLDNVTYFPLEVRLANFTVGPPELRAPWELLDSDTPLLRTDFFEGWLDDDIIFSIILMNFVASLCSF
ncbi:uncharacterized protein DS421_13g440740 [Arachis hypogaea]|nr:uncharacterized protein DS421_13g440740 [Arachis hypogaea]